MSTAIGVRAILGKDVLVARESARELATAIAASPSSKPGQIELDVKGISVISPSFFDELLQLIEKSTAERSVLLRQIDITNSLADIGKFDTVARTYNLRIEARGQGRWRLSRHRRLR